MNAVREPEPGVELRISAEMRRLFQAYRAGVQEPVADPEPEPEPEICAAPPPAEPVPMPDFDWQTLSLRRDGARPLHCRAVPLIELACETPEGDRHEFSVLLTDRDEIGIVCRFLPEGLSARPVHTAALCRSADALQSALDSHDPAMGFGLCDAQPGPMQAAKAAQAAFDALVASAAMTWRPNPSTPRIFA
ncbi:MAG: hypothetical protein AAF074_07790 [Pseudomonadota bacterium]